MAFDGAGISSTAFDHIGINGTLHQNIDISQLPGFFLKDTNELFPDDPALAFRLRHTVQLLQKALFGIYPDQIHTELTTENTLHPVALVFSQQTVIDKYTGQVLSDGLVQQHSSNRTVHAAAEGAQDFLSR